jgi:TusA-related sulfurtransferase
MDSPSRLKQTQMHGQVLEINCSDPEAGMLILKTVQQQGQIPLLEVALYGAQIHVVLPDVREYKEAIRNILLQKNIQVNSLEWIAPTLEDVFISSVTKFS